MNEEYYYGEVKEFKTVEEKQGMCPDGNHPHMIDLGLAAMWEPLPRKNMEGIMLGVR